MRSDVVPNLNLLPPALEYVNFIESSQGEWGIYTPPAAAARGNQAAAAGRVEVLLGGLGTGWA